jgi:hypothetical protein
MFRTQFSAVVAALLPLQVNCPRALDLNTDGRITQKSDLSHEQHRFSVIETPVNELTVLKAVKRVETLLSEDKSVDRINERKKYAADLQAVLRMCDLQDKYFNERGEKVAKKKNDAGGIVLKRRTVCRVIHCLGNLEAADAAGTIAEFLLMNEDLSLVLGLPRPGDLPTDWALFQIGDPALPVLRVKMTQENPLIRRRAALSASQVLGPRANAQLQSWLTAAESIEERERLREATGLFALVTQNTKHSDSCTYRESRLRLGQDRNAALLVPNNQDLLDRLEKQ